VIASARPTQSCFAYLDAKVYRREMLTINPLGRGYGAATPNVLLVLR